MDLLTAGSQRAQGSRTGEWGRQEAYKALTFLDLTSEYSASPSTRPETLHFPAEHLISPAPTAPPLSFVFVPGGPALLPFLWLVNVLWFCREAFLAPAYTEQPQIKSYVQRSAMGLLFWVIVLTTWVTIFQTHRARWGELGDYLSFTIPLGIP
ncbi:Gamma-secretase subunit PEN-2 [Chelonia mydas]|uniref:Gamma-secretase subunit PEN-2 n=1 Tax=Chelonia mydas TaxID=8469 RepID=M7BNX3_CHEMY|nr:Gamma-secretase subunit PEN-2 [Chelonia mydas]